MRFFIGLIAIVAASCGGAPLSYSFESAEAMSRAVLEAVEQHDRDALRALALNKEEFTEHVWPQLPAARPERNLSPSFVWMSLNQKSSIMLRHVLAAHGGKKYQLVRVHFLGQTTQFGSFQVHRDGELTVKDAQGREQQVRMFGSVLQKNGRYKVFSYVIDD
jgi:hypothetical protein